MKAGKQTDIKNYDLPEKLNSGAIVVMLKSLDKAQNVPFVV